MCRRSCGWGGRQFGVRVWAEVSCSYRRLFLCHETTSEEKGIADGRKEDCWAEYAVFSPLQTSSRIVRQEKQKGMSGCVGREGGR